MNRGEFRRLQKAHKKSYDTGNKEYLFEWASNLEKNITEELRKEYEKNFIDELENAIDSFIISLMYVLHFSEKTKFGPKRLQEIMNDINATVDMFNTGEYSPNEYKEILEKDGIFLKSKGKKK